MLPVAHLPALVQADGEGSSVWLESAPSCQHLGCVPPHTDPAIKAEGTDLTLTSPPHNHVPKAHIHTFLKCPKE